MQTETGKIFEGDQDELVKRLGGHFVEVDPDDMTKKQKRDGAVSLSDRRSRLGKKLTEYRSSLGLTKNQSRNLRNRLKKS